MTYEALETGVGGAPIEMFLFQLWESCWQYTSSDTTQEHEGRTYVPRTVSRGAFERNDEAGSSTVTIRVDRTLKVADQFIDGSSPRPVSATIYRKHRADGEVIVLFRGVVANAEVLGEEVVLTCVSPLSAEDKSIPRELIMRTCPHVHFGTRCQLDPDDYAVTGGSVQSVTDYGRQIDLTGLSWTYDADHFNAGVLMKNSNGARGFIRDSKGLYLARVHLLTPIPGLTGGDAVTLWPGCDRKHTTCRDKFDNIPNFGGFPLHPERNPFIELKVE